MFIYIIRHVPDLTISRLFRIVKCTSPDCHQGSAPFLSIYDEDCDACRFCSRNSLVEDRTKRIQYTSRFLAISPLATTIEGGKSMNRVQFRRTLIVKLKDDLSERDFKLGDEMILTGVMFSNFLGSLPTSLIKLPGFGQTHHWYFNAYSVQQVSAKEVFSVYAPALPSLAQSCPERFLQRSKLQSLFIMCTAQIEAAANLILPDLSYFFKLRVGLLLAAVSGNYDAAGSGRANVHILCKGGHSEILGRFFRSLSDASFPIPTSGEEPFYLERQLE